MVNRTNPNPPGIPRTEEQRKEQHKELTGSEELPKRGTGFEMNPKLGNIKPDYAGWDSVKRYFETGQTDLTATTSTYKVVQLRGGQAVIIKALNANSGNVYIGQINVSTTTGFELCPGEALKIEYFPQKDIGEYLDVYAVAATAGDDVCYIIVP